MPAERHRRLGPVGGQRHQPLALAAGQDDRQDPVRHGAHATPVVPRSTPCASTCSPASTRPRSTEAPASTSSTSPGSCARLVDVRVHCFGAPRDEPGVTAYARPPRPGRRQRGAAHARDRPGDGGRLRGQRPGALAHLVRQPRRPRRQAAARRAARDDRAQPGAAAAVEGRAARRRLRAVVLGRADRRRGGRRGHRGVGRACATTCCAATRTSTRTGCTWCTTASTPRSTSPTRHRRARAARHRPGPAVGASSSAGSPGRRACPHLLRAALSLDPAVQLVLCAGAPDTAGDPRRGDACSSTSCGRTATASSGSRRCCPSPR